MSEYSRYRQYYQRIEPILKKPHFHAYTMAVLSLFTLSFFGSLAIRPAVKEIFELDRKIEDRHLVNQKLDEKIKNLNTAQGEYENIQADLPLILTALPQESNFPPFIKKIEETASKSAISLTNLKFQGISLLDPNAQKAAKSATTSTPPQEFSFNLDVSGAYPDLFTFLRNLENGRRIINIGEFSISSEKRGTASAGLRTSVRARTYFSNIKIERREPNE